METKRRKRFILGAAALILGLFVCLVILHFEQPHSRRRLVCWCKAKAPRLPENATYAASAAAAEHLSATLRQHHASPEELAASRRAINDLRTAMSWIVTATSYRRVYRVTNADGSFAETVGYYKKSSTGADLYRTDAYTGYQNSSKPPALNYEEIKNSEGNFLVTNLSEGTPLVFSLANETTPEPMVRAREIAALAADPNSISEEATLNYSESQNIAPDGSGETLINDANPNPKSVFADHQTRIDNLTGRITGSEYYGPDGQDVSSVDEPALDVNPALDDSFFDVPASAQVIPATNKASALLEAALYRHPRTK
jgi:hypothetical protein